MADETKPAGQDPELESTDGDGEGEGKKSMTPLVVLIYVGVVFAASALTELVIVPKASEFLASRGHVHVDVVEDTTAKFGEIYVIEDLVVNPKGSGGTRYVAASVGLESLASALPEIERRDPQIKDALIHILGSRTIEELADVATREEIRGEIKARVQSFVPENSIHGVYFVSFVLQ